MSQIGFDDVLDQTVQIIESFPFVANLEAITIIRDLKGKVNLLLEFQHKLDDTDDLPTDWEQQQAQLKQALGQALGAYWSGNLWRDKKKDNDKVMKHLHETIRNSRQDWYPSQSKASFKWHKLERLFSKSSWQPNHTPQIWPQEKNKPSIVSFYSFKGGVGRTTALAAIAILIAREGKRVFILDLDLEAPGIGPLLLEDIPSPNKGIVDYLLEWQLLKMRPSNLSIYIANQTNLNIIGSGTPLQIMTAGQMNMSFLEKMARLDFEGFSQKTTNPLLELLNHISDEYNPDFILLDLRSGLHDIGGLSLNSLSHLDILFGRETPQSWQGLKIVMEILGNIQYRHAVFLVHSMAPSKADSLELAHEEFKIKSYDLFQEKYYTQNETIPYIDDPDSPYGGLPIKLRDELVNINQLSRVIEHFISTSSDNAYRHLTERILSFFDK